MSTVANVQSITAGLAPDSQQVISGVAIGIGDITRGLSGDRKVWRAEQLREAATSLEGTPINPLHSQSEVGEIVRAGFDPERGVVYEARLEDESLAEQVADGGLEVSIEAQHADGGRVETDRGKAMLATDIQFTGMALVQHGAAPSASASAGEAAALSPAEISDALADKEAEAAEMTPTYQEGDAVAWDWSDGTANGRIDDVITAAGTVERTIGGSDVARDSDDEPVYVLDVWRGGDYEGQALKSESELDEWSDPPEDAMMADPMADIPEEYVFDNPGEAVSKADEMGFDGAGDEMIHTRDDGDGTVFMPGPTPEALMDELGEEAAAAADPDDPEQGEVSVDGESEQAANEQPQRFNAHMSETEEELRARLSEKDDRIAELEQENSELKDEREDVARAYASALADTDTVFDEDELVDRFEVSELAAKVENHESATLADVEPDVQSGGSEASEEATLSESEQAEAAEHREVIADLAGKGGVAKHERQRRAALVGEITGEDPETILEQEA